MSSAKIPRFVVIDDFLAPDLLTAIEAHVAGQEAAMVLSDTGDFGDNAYAAPRRRFEKQDALGPLQGAFEAAVMGRFEELCTASGVAPFPVARMETEVCVHRDGHYFGPHIDTDTRAVQARRTTDRIISAVFYFPKEPRAFTGGELVLFSFAGKGASEPIEPRRNRLVAFPSFAFHEVTPLALAEDTFENARFSINCWLHRAKPAAS